MKICLFSMLTIFLMASVAGCSKDTKDPYGSHLSADGVCIGDLHGCPATFDLAQCRAAVGDVGACDGDHLLYTFAADVPGMLGDYPYWMCFYDGISKQLTGSAFASTTSPSAPAATCAPIRPARPTATTSGCSLPSVPTRARRASRGKNDPSA